MDEHNLKIAGRLSVISTLLVTVYLIFSLCFCFFGVIITFLRIRVEDYKFSSIFWCDFVYIAFFVICLIASITVEIIRGKNVKRNNIGKAVCMLKISLTVKLLSVIGVAIIFGIMCLLKITGISILTWMYSCLKLWPVILIGYVLVLALSIKALSIGVKYMKDEN